MASGVGLIHTAILLMLSRISDLSHLTQQIGQHESALIDVVLVCVLQSKYSNYMYFKIPSTSLVLETISCAQYQLYFGLRVILFLNRSILSSPDCSNFVSSCPQFLARRNYSTRPREVNSRLFVHTTAEQTLIDLHRLH